jgi:hypothetical protein
MFCNCWPFARVTFFPARTGDGLTDSLQGLSSSEVQQHNMYDLFRSINLAVNANIKLILIVMGGQRASPSICHV